MSVLRRGGRRTRRLTTIVVLLGCLSIGTALILSALRENIVFFLVPSDILERLEAGDLDGQRVRLGGLVVEGSVARNKDSGEVRFLVTDGAARVAVRYRGLLPDLFREGQGVVAAGTLVVAKSDEALPLLDADQLLAKHDEYYIPRGLERALKKRNLWRERP